MKNLIKILIAVILIAHVPIKCIAQDSTYIKTFISLNSGVFFPSWREFKEAYHSPCAFINGGSLGIPISNKHFFFYVKAMYFQKTGNQIIYHFENNNGEVVMYTTREIGRAHV